MSFASNRAARRRRGKRESFREGVQGVGRIMELRRKGYSAAAIAARLPVSKRAVQSILDILEGEPEGTISGDGRKNGR